MKWNWLLRWPATSCRYPFSQFNSLLSLNCLNGGATRQPLVSLYFISFICGCVRAAPFMNKIKVRWVKEVNHSFVINCFIRWVNSFQQFTSSIIYFNWSWWMDEEITKVITHPIHWDEIHSSTHSFITFILWVDFIAFTQFMEWKECNWRIKLV